MGEAFSLDSIPAAAAAVGSGDDDDDDDDATRSIKIESVAAALLVMDMEGCVFLRSECKAVCMVPFI
jgi:predicted tellurium resistance membrane protein TerC